HDAVPDRGRAVVITARQLLEVRRVHGHARRLHARHATRLARRLPRPADRVDAWMQPPVTLTVLHEPTNVRRPHLLESTTTLHQSRQGVVERVEDLLVERVCTTRGHLFEPDAVIEQHLDDAT